jgi:hypothetical protein
MKSCTKWYIAGAIVIIVTTVVLFRFVKTQGDAVGGMPGSAGNWFQQIGDPSLQGTDEPIVIIRK